GVPPPAPGSAGGLAVRVGLGYVKGVREADARTIVSERERSGPFASVAELAARCAARRDTLERLAWAGACDALVGAVDGHHAATARRRALWLLGASTPGDSVPGGIQLALPLEPADPPALPGLSPWEQMLADYGSTSVTLREHPLELMRPGLASGVRSSADLERVRHGERVRVAGMVVARQRPATARGVTFLLLEDEHGTINLIVSPPVFERHRQMVRAEVLVLAEGRLERREGVTNVVVAKLGRLERPDLPLAEVRHIEPGRAWSTERRGDELRDGGGEEAEADLRAVAPVAHSFGRRGR
ncbi:MAG TPA: OB-fold nucleic acid binding domain-containing protein, partial [Thermoleophilaceae bacterium]|nr:OB-fold nucleic acid binding domain-containing protein [Thermoleophilaceae bacterium]